MIEKTLAYLFSKLFHLLYHSFAWSYDAVAFLVSTGLWKEWVAQSIPYLIGPVVLELGFGPGHLQKMLLAQNLTAYGLDESRQMVEQASRRIAKAQRSMPNHGYAKDIRLARGLAQHIPFQSGFFNTVVTTFPTPYIFSPETLTEIRRVLASGGSLVVVMSGRITDQAITSRVASLLLLTTGQDEKWYAPWKNRLEEAGFTSQLQWVPARRSQVLILLARVAPATSGNNVGYKNDLL